MERLKLYTDYSQLQKVVQKSIYFIGNAHPTLMLGCHLWAQLNINTLRGGTNNTFPLSKGLFISNLWNLTKTFSSLSAPKHSGKEQKDKMIFGELDNECSNTDAKFPSKKIRKLRKKILRTNCQFLQMPAGITPITVLQKIKPPLLEFATSTSHFMSINTKWARASL